MESQQLYPKRLFSVRACEFRTLLYKYRDNLCSTHSRRQSGSNADPGAI